MPSSRKDVLQPYLRNTGPGLSPFNAWVLLKGLETLGAARAGHERRARRGSRAGWKPSQASRSVLYPGLREPSRSTSWRARQMTGGGSLVAFRGRRRPGRGVRVARTGCG